MEWRQISSSFTYWIDRPSLHQSDQLEEAVRCGQRDSKKASTSRENGVVICSFPEIEGSKGFLVEQREQSIGQNTKTQA